MPFKLQDLPVEVLSEIASHLDLESLSSLQQTSKKLQEAAEAHSVWLTLAQEYSAQHFHLHRPELGLITNLNTGDLRHWIRRRLIADHLWRAQGLKPHIRMLPDQRFVVPVLVPGGRWLLVGHLYGRLCYYDLDSEDLECADLICPSEDIKGSHQHINDLKIDIDQDAPALEFKIAMSGFSHGSNTKWLHIWQARMKGGESLVAERLTSVPAYLNNAGSRLLSLNRHLLARNVVMRADLTWIEIYWWKQCSFTSILRSAFPVACKPDNVFLIGDNKILCTKTPATVELYDLPEPNYTHTELDTVIIAPSAPAHDPIWSHTFSNDGKASYSPMYCDGEMHRLVVSTNKGIWGLVLSTKKGDAPSIAQLSTFSNSQAVCVPAIRKALALYGEGVHGIRIGYSWNGGRGGVFPIQRALKPSPYTYGQPSFDEENGRFVWRMREAIMVVDLLHEVSGDIAT